MGCDKFIPGELRALLGDADYLTLVENFGGLRTYIPSNADQSELLHILGVDALSKLAEDFGGLYIKVPLDREFRAIQYRQQGMSNRQIAIRLCLTEGGVERLIARVRRSFPGQVPPPTPRPKAEPKIRVEKPRKPEDPRIVAIKGYFLEHAPKAPNRHPQQHIANAFNLAHKGQFYLAPQQSYHWYRWAMEEHARRSGAAGVLSRRK